MSPTFWEVARRPRWIGALAFALLTAAIFAALGQWQVARAVEQGQADERDTETPVALTSVAEPQQPMTSEAGGRMVEVEASVDPASFVVLVGRGQEGSEGAWLTARAVTADGDSIALALGWAATAEEAEAAIDDVDLADATLVGRYMPSESPTEADFEGGTVDAMSVAQLINVWPGFDGDVYAGYVIVAEPVGDLGSIVSLPPEQQTQLNWLNVFYAIEWVAFALFAVYLWYRLVQDAREREAEEAEEAAAAAAGGSGRPTATR